MRDVDARLAWFLGNKPVKAGRCAEHTWHSLDVPKQGCPDATCLWKRVRNENRLQSGPRPRGSIMYWSGGSQGYGHVALAYGPNTVASVDTHGGGTVGVRPFSWFATNWPALKYQGWSWWFGNINTQVKETSVDEYGFDDPNKSLEVGRSYVRFTVDEWNPKRDGLQFAKRYSKGKPVFYTGKSGGALRFKCVRTNPEDPTFYHDEGVSTDMLDDDGFFLRSFASFESGENERNLFWMVKCIGGMKSCTITSSRYSGFAVQD